MGRWRRRSTSSSAQPISVPQPEEVWSDFVLREQYCEAVHPVIRLGFERPHDHGP